METIDSIKASWKNLLSFSKRKWKFEDYPVRIRKQSSVGAMNFPPYSAQIINWWIAGTGNTKAEAVQSLRANFEKYAQSNKLPRPGEKVPVQFASTNKIEEHGEFAYEFLSKIFDFSDEGGPLFVSDESSLFDFHSLATGDLSVEEKIKEVYAVDVTGIEDRLIWKILNLIKAKKERR